MVPCQNFSRDKLLFAYLVMPVSTGHVHTLPESSTCSLLNFLTREKNVINHPFDLSQKARLTQKMKTGNDVVPNLIPA